MTTPRLGAPELVQNQATPETTVNETFYWLDAASLGGFKVLDRDLSTPPASPSQGDCYIVTGTLTDDWSTGTAGDVALYFGTAWELRTPDDGWEAWVVDEAVKVAYSSGSWGIIGTFDGADYIPSSYLDTDDTLAADSDVKVPSQQAVKAYVDNAIGATAYIPPAVSTQSGTSYTAVLGDANTFIRFTSASTVTFTIPPNSSVAFPVGTEIHFSQSGAGALSVAAGSGVTVNSRSSDLSLAGQYAVAFVKKLATDTWIMNGDL